MSPEQARRAINVSEYQIYLVSQRNTVRRTSSQKGVMLMLIYTQIRTYISAYEH